MPPQNQDCTGAPSPRLQDGIPGRPTNCSSNTRPAIPTPSDVETDASDTKVQVRKKGQPRLVFTAGSKAGNFRTRIETWLVRLQAGKPLPGPMGLDSAHGGAQHQPAKSATGWTDEGTLKFTSRIE